MFKILVLLLSVLVLSSCINPNPQQLVSSVVRIKNNNSSGSGVVIKQEGKNLLILTNQHVVQNSLKVLVHYNYLNASEDAEALVLKTDSKLDLAIIYVQAPTQVSPVPYSLCSEPLLAFDKVYTIGAGFGKEVFVGEGIVANPIVENSHIQISAPIYPGNSGGALITNQYGEYCLAGITDSGIQTGGDFYGNGNPTLINFAIPVRIIKPFIDEYF